MGDFINLSSVSFAFKRACLPIFDKIDISFSNKGLVALLGKNGSGKTTFLNLILGFLKQINGIIKIDNEDSSKISFTEKSKIISYIPQFNPNIPRYYTIENFILEGLRPFKNVFSKYDKNDYDELEKIINLLSLGDFKSKCISELSGGEKQRVILARAIIKKPKIYLLDEPFSAMDIFYKNMCVSILKDITENKNSLALIIDHDINFAINSCQYTCLLQKPNILYYGLSANIDKATLSKAYDYDFRFVDKEFKLYF